MEIFLKINKILLVFSISILLIISAGIVSANDNQTTDTLNSETPIDNTPESYSSSNVLSVQYEDEIESAQDNYIINQRNYKMYFDDTNTLKQEYGGKIITFDGEFTDKGTITINTDNTRITWKNTLFNNTVFNIKANGVMLTNLKFVLNESFTGNNNTGVYVTGDNVTIYNIDMTYDTPGDVDAIGVYSYDNTGFKLINSSFNYIGHAFHDGHNYPILLQYSDDAYVSGNNINSTLPLREVDWSGEIYGGVGMDKVSSYAAGVYEPCTFN